MSLKNIRTAAIGRLGSLLTTSKEIKNVFNIEDNEERTLVSGYGVRFGECRETRGVTRTIAMNSSLVVILTRALSARAADEIAPEIGNIYDDVETIIASFMNDTFLGIPSYLKGFTNCSVLEPKIIAGLYVQIDIRFTANHAFNINYS
jgi:hypothetical protein